MDNSGKLAAQRMIFDKNGGKSSYTNKMEEE